MLLSSNGKYPHTRAKRITPIAQISDWITWVLPRVEIRPLPNLFAVVMFTLDKFWSCVSRRSAVRGQQLARNASVGEAIVNDSNFHVLVE